MAQSPEPLNWEESMEQKRGIEAFWAPQAKWQQMDGDSWIDSRKVHICWRQNWQLNKELFLLNNKKKFEKDQQISRFKKQYITNERHKAINII